MLAALGDPELVPARVVGRQRGSCQVATPGGPSVLQASGAVVATAVGDWLAIGVDGAVSVLPRWSCLERIDASGRRQVLASNVDLVLVAAPADRLSPSRVEREIAIAWHSGARPVVVLTKSDLAPPGAIEDLAARLGDVTVVATSAARGSGLAELEALLVPPVTAALLGPSGAGKSTLVNVLVGADLLAVGPVREGDRRGRHTTASRQLVALPSGGSLVDMPGVRSLGTDASRAAVAAAFADVEALASRCRFADCAHGAEPGCEVMGAVARGALDPARLSSYRTIADQAAAERRRTAEHGHAAGPKAAPPARTKEQRRAYRDREL
jgi:ribosome biogenesis GTPase